MAKDNKAIVPPQGPYPPLDPGARLWQAETVGLPFVEADLCADHRR